ncbi:hypothetical protein [Brachybacterium phenoliresistens]|uniref:Membrane protein n=1 Tax=Brachybacterium phenoliresistens TaxID=396014 RepID=Z9JTN2_9MICO|nr:hypothetical protein [Brachybacterium phenoliresistens]EWS81393.1 membrane protein [Brachybacterium phenoliresistens]
MKTSHLSLLVGLLLGAVLAFGTFSQFFLVLVFAMVGLAVGLVIDGRIDIQGISERRRG